MGFKPLTVPDSIRRYARYCGRFVVSLYRLGLDCASYHSSLYEPLSPTIKNGINNLIEQVDGKNDEQIKVAIVKLLSAVLQEEKEPSLPSTSFSLYRFMVFTMIDFKGRLKPVHFVTPALAMLTYLCRLLIVHKIKKDSPGNSHM